MGSAVEFDEPPTAYRSASKVTPSNVVLVEAPESIATTSGILVGAPELLDELELLLDVLLDELELLLDVLLDELELDELELLEELEDDDELPLPGLLPPQPPNINAHMTGNTAKRDIPILQNLLTRTPKIKFIIMMTLINGKTRPLEPLPLTKARSTQAGLNA